MRNDDRRDRPERLAFGVGLIVLGILLTLGQLDLLPVRGMQHLWPTFILMAGVGKLLTPRYRSTGVFLVGLSLVFFAHSLGWAALHRTWPVLFVLGGLAMVWQALVGDRSREQAS
jgi:hypothetical protein